MKSARILWLVIALFAITACGGGNDVETPTNVLNRGLVSDPETLDAHKARSLQSADVLRDLGEGLVTFTSTAEVAAGTAESWDVSEDGLNYTFHLRTEARWSNGDPVTAAHFVFGFERLVDPATAAFYAQFLSDISGIEAVDDQTLIITVNRPTPFLLSLLAHPATFPMHPGSLAEHGDNFARPGTLLSNGASP